jgi:hypothetical protein
MTMSARSWTILAAAATLVVSVQGAVPAATGAEAHGVRAATDTWTPVHVFERDPRGEAVVVGPRGATTVVWGSQKGWPEPVKAARRMPDGRWLTPVKLGVGYQPVVAADAEGNLVAAWCRDRQGFTTGVWAARKPVGKPWTRPVHISRDKVAPHYPDGGSAYGAMLLDITVGRAGSALVTWEWGNWERNLPNHLQAVYRPAHGTWGPVVPLTPRSEAHNAHAAFARDGTAWVTYELTPAKGPARVAVRSRTKAGWGPARTLGRGSLGDVSVTARGDVTVMSLRDQRVRVSLRPAATGTWQQPFALTPKEARVRIWSVATNGSGDVLVAYRWPGRSVNTVRGLPGGRWTRSKLLADTEDQVWALHTAINAGGDMFVGWDDGYGIWGSARPAADGWHAVTTPVPDTGSAGVLEDTHVTMSPQGDVVLLWAQEDRPLRLRTLAVG